MTRGNKSKNSSFFYIISTWSAGRAADICSPPQPWSSSRPWRATFCRPWRAAGSRPLLGQAVTNSITTISRSNWEGPWLPAMATTPISGGPMLRPISTADMTGSLPSQSPGRRPTGRRSCRLLAASFRAFGRQFWAIRVINATAMAGAAALACALGLALRAPFRHCSGRGYSCSTRGRIRSLRTS